MKLEAVDTKKQHIQKNEFIFVRSKLLAHHYFKTKFLRSLNYVTYCRKSKRRQKTDSRTISYESFKNETKIVIGKQLTVNEWATVNHMAVPIAIFDYRQLYGLKRMCMEIEKHWETRRFNSRKVRVQW